MNIKRTIIFIILVTIYSSNVNAQFAVTFKNAKHNYSINLPKNLEVTEFPETNNADTMIAKNNDGSEFIVLTKFDNLYKGINGSQLSPKSFMPDLKAKFKNVELIETYGMDISGEPALFMKVDFKNEEMDGVVSQFLLIRGEKIYIIRIVSKKENYDKFSSEISGYIFTFQFFESSNKNFYKNDIYNFIIYFPAGWSFDKGTFPVQAYNSKGSSIYIEVLKSFDYEGMTSNDIEEDVMIEALKTKFTNISLVGKKKYIIDGHPVLMLKYKWIQVSGGKNEGIFVIHYYLIKKNLMFIIQGMIKDNGLKDDEKLIEQALQSFQFIK